MARASAEARPVWLEAKATSNFELFLPVLERNVELRRRYVDCFDAARRAVRHPARRLRAGDEDRRGDAHLRRDQGGARAADRRAARPRGRRLVPHRRLSRRPSRIALDHEVVDLFGHRPDTWRIDPTEHPFASGAGIDDIRITTHYYPRRAEVALLDDARVRPRPLPAPAAARVRAPAGRAATRRSASTSRRAGSGRTSSAAACRSGASSIRACRSAFPEQLGGVELEQFYAAINKVAAVADPHRGGRGHVRDARHPPLRARAGHHQRPRRACVTCRELWAEKMHEYLGVEVPDDAHGVLQDMHWASGLIGYFSTYLLGTVMSVQIWEKVLEDVPRPRGADRARRVRARCASGSGENIHAHGRKFSPQETLRARDRQPDRREAVPRVSQARSTARASPPSPARPPRAGGASLRDARAAP